jgi:hypothetical protein
MVPKRQKPAPLRPLLTAGKGASSREAFYVHVITGLVPVTHVGPTAILLESKACSGSTWVAGTSPAMTKIDNTVDFPALIV